MAWTAENAKTGALDSSSTHPQSVFGKGTLDESCPLEQTWALASSSKVHQNTPHPQAAVTHQQIGRWYMKSSAMSGLKLRVVTQD